MSATLPPGWYPDEDEPSAQRYWDGTQWGPSIPSGDGTPAAPAPVDQRWPYRDRAIRVKGALLITAMVLIAAGFLWLTQPHLWDRRPHHQHGHAVVTTATP